MKKTVIKLIKNHFPKNLREIGEKLVGRRVYHPLFDNYRCIFIHIPKTAGSSIGHAIFGTHQTGHWKLITYRWTNSNKFDRYFKFTFVRNPWDRLASAYFYLAEGGKTKNDREWSKKNISHFKSFEDFVTRGLSNDNILNWVHFVPQLNFIRDIDGHINVDFVGKYENLKEDFEYVCNKLNINTELPHKNHSNRLDYRKIYSSSMIQKVQEVYSDDIEFFNYNF